MLKVSCQGHRRRTVFNHLCFDIAFIPFVDVSQLFRVDIVHIVAILRTAGSTGLVDKRSVNLEGVEGMFPGEAVLQPDETITADFVYQVPQGFNNFMLMFQEFFEDESLGDLFVVKFTANME